MKKAPFKMKGNPMKRNFGISPMKQDPGKEREKLLAQYEKQKERAKKEKEKLLAQYEEQKKNIPAKRVGLAAQAARYFKKI